LTRRALPLVAVVLLAAGCGRTYSAGDVQRALGTSTAAALQYYVDSPQTVFATSAAVTDLVIAETPPLPQGVYDASDISVERYRDSHEAWLATQHPHVVIVAQSGERIIVRRYANLILIGEFRRVGATLALLH
jgi:hypothetical protein